MNPHLSHPSTPLTLFTSLWKNRRLVRQMAWREISARYRGSFIGLAWSFFNPILMLLVYTFVFSVVFHSRWGTSSIGNKADVAIILYAGLIVQGLFSECINRAPKLIIENVNYVKKVVFPLETISWVSMGSALFNTAVNVIVLLIGQLIISRTIPWTSLAFPLVLLPLVLGVMGLSWFLSSLGVYVRDIGQLVVVVTMVLLYLSPVFYPLSAIPVKYQPLLKLNPLTLTIEQSREVLIFGRFPNWASLLAQLVVGAIIASIGFWWFQKTRRGFADVL